MPGVGTKWGRGRSGSCFLDFVFFWRSLRGRVSGASVRVKETCRALEACCGQGSAGRSGLPIMGCGQAEAELPVGRDAAWGLRDPDGGLNLMLCQIPLIHDSETAVFCVSHWVVLTEKRSGRRSRNSFVTPPPIVPCALQVASFEHTPRITGWEQRVVQQPR